MKVTIKQVAETAGVSRGTVDRVLNGRPYVKEEKRKKVLDAIEQLGYEKNWAAKALGMQNNIKKIAFILPKLESKGFIDDIYRAIKQAKKELSSFGIELIDRQCQTRMQDNKASAQEYIQIFDEIAQQSVDGIIVYAMDHPLIRDRINELVQDGIPVIAVNSDIHDCKRVCFIGDDEYRNGRIAGELLIKCADLNKDILVITASYRYYSSKARINGFCDIFAEQGNIPGKYEIFECYNSYEMTYAVVLENLKKNPNIRTIYLSTENVLGCIDAIRESDLAYPITLICHGSVEYYKKLVVQNDITFLIAQNVFEQGYRSIEVMRDMVFYKQYPEQDSLYTPPSIVCKELIRD